MTLFKKQCDKLKIRKNNKTSINNKYGIFKDVFLQFTVLKERKQNTQKLLPISLIFYQKPTTNNEKKTKKKWQRKIFKKKQANNKHLLRERKVNIHKL